MYQDANGTKTSKFIRQTDVRIKSAIKSKDIIGYSVTHHIIMDETSFLLVNRCGIPSPRTFAYSYEDSG